MFDRIWTALIKTHYRKIDARLDGYRRLTVKGEVYPGIIMANHSAVDGVLMLAIEEADLSVLDSFEGEFYRRTEVDVSTSDGRLCPAHTYVFRDRYRHMLGNTEWDIDKFRNDEIEIFVSGYSGLVQHKAR
jgi:hypothetical protein